MKNKLNYYVEETVEMCGATKAFLKDLAVLELLELDFEEIEIFNRKLEYFHNKYGFSYTEYKEAIEIKRNEIIEESSKNAEEAERACNEFEEWEYNMVSDGEVPWGSQSWDL